MRPALALAIRASGYAAALAVLAASIAFGHDILARRPIDAVRFTGDAARVPAADLERLAAGLRGREAREVALPAVREAVRRLPWVRDCTVRRMLAGTLEVAIEAHDPLARWDEDRLVSVRGELFAAPHEAALPLFSGPEGAAAEMAAAWPRLREAAAPLPVALVELRLTERRAWQARLANGLSIELGRGEIEARLARFAAAWPLIAAEAAGATRADLRYPNGFALRGVAAGEAPVARGGRGA